MIPGRRHLTFAFDHHGTIRDHRDLWNHRSLPSKRHSNLMSVACRVKEWVEPLLYWVVCTGGMPTFMTNIPLKKPPDFLTKAMKHLFLSCPADPAELNTILMA
ncbi:hypothetical protein MVEN_00880300 [Mycena venus]|uniref:Uncharacterized protein n=1 Tax=Mycena venus TaxID=2733690 RepID=A0A8H6YHE9_9AGAR|nr:hypothetical protein MVEN_00880300 [Mycena venus]